MKRTGLVILFALISLGSVCAQEKNPNRWEVGVGYALQFGYTDDDVNMTRAQSIPAYFEWRRDLGRHWDFGARLDTNSGLAGDGYYKGAVIYAGLLAVTDFNFLPGRAVNPFIGLGAGPGIGSINVGYSYVKFMFSVNPRFGVEIVDHLRISAGLNISSNFQPLFMPVYLTLGWTF